MAIKKPKKKKSNKIKVPVSGRPAVTAPREPRIAQNGYTRPKPTRKNGKHKVTFRVWQICDEISAKKAQLANKNKTTAEPATRQEVLAATKAEKINYTTFCNCFYHWRRFNGLFGRKLKEKPTVKKKIVKVAKKKAKGVSKNKVVKKSKQPVSGRPGNAKGKKNKVTTKKPSKRRAVLAVNKAAVPVSEAPTAPIISFTGSPGTTVAEG